MICFHTVLARATLGHFHPRLSSRLCSRYCYFFDFTLCNSVSVQTEISIPAKDSLLTLSKMFSQLMVERGVVVPSDFLLYRNETLCCIWSLQCFAKGLGTLQNDGWDSSFPCKQMPMGLVEFVCSFFASENRNQGFCFGCRYK